MTVTQRRAAVRSALIADPRRSDRRIAAGIGCSRELVALVRSRLEQSGSIARTPVRGLDGKLYPGAELSRPRPKDVARIAEKLNEVLHVMRSPEFVEAWQRTAESPRKHLAAGVFEINREAARLRRQA